MLREPPELPVGPVVWRYRVEGAAAAKLLRAVERAAVVAMQAQRHGFARLAGVLLQPTEQGVEVVGVDGVGLVTTGFAL
jgi:hypothetical protein